MLSSLLSCSLLYPKLSNFSVSFIRFWWRFSTFFALCNKLRKLCLALLYHWNLSVRSSIVRTLFSPARFPFLFVPLHIVFVLSHCFSLYHIKNTDLSSFWSFLKFWFCLVATEVTTPTGMNAQRLLWLELSQFTPTPTKSCISLDRTLA